MQLEARFIDDEIEPRYLSSSGKKHYRIKISVNDAPKTAYLAIYTLHETFIDPERTVQSPPNFPLQITSYGDFSIQVEVRCREKILPIRVAAGLVDLIKEYYSINPSMSSPAVREAIDILLAQD
jgi:hypothetical protein